MNRPIETLECRRLRAVNLYADFSGAGAVVTAGVAASADGPAVSLFVRNVGKTTAKAARAQLYLSSDRTLDAADTALADVAVPRLAYRKSRSIDVPLSAPAGTADGSYFLIARVEPNAADTDTDSSNNVYVSQTAQLIVGRQQFSNTIAGNAGDDVIRVSYDFGVTKIVVNGKARYANASDQPLTVELGAGDDLFDGNAAGRTVLVLGGIGNDTIIAGYGNDTLGGGAGNDKLFGGDSGDVLEGGGGNDTLDGGPGSDRLLGGAGHDVLVGGGNHDRLYGGPGDDTLYARDGLFDYLYGESGNDSAQRDDGDFVFNDDVETTL